MSTFEEERARLSDHLQQYVSNLEKLIQQLKDCKNPSKEFQLHKLERLHSMITDRKKNLKLETLKKCEDVVLKILQKVNLNTVKHDALLHSPIVMPTENQNIKNIQRKNTEKVNKVVHGDTKKPDNQTGSPRTEIAIKEPDSMFGNLLEVGKVLTGDKKVIEDQQELNNQDREGDKKDSKGDICELKSDISDNTRKEVESDKKRQDKTKTFQRLADPRLRKNSIDDLHKIAPQNESRVIFDKNIAAVGGVFYKTDTPTLSDPRKKSFNFQPPPQLSPPRASLLHSSSHVTLSPNLSTTTNTPSETFHSYNELIDSNKTQNEYDLSEKQPVDFYSPYFNQTAAQPSLSPFSYAADKAILNPRDSRRCDNIPLDPRKEIHLRFDPRKVNEARLDPRQQNEARLDAGIEKEARFDPRKASGARLDPHIEKEARFDPRKESETRLDPRRENLASFDPRIEKEARFDPRKDSGGRFDPPKESETCLDPRRENVASFDPRIEKKARFDPRKASGGRFDLRKENETRLDLRRENLASFDPRIEKEARFDPRKASEGRFDPRKESETCLDPRRENVASFDPRIEKKARFDPRKASGGRYDLRKESETCLDPRRENVASFDPRIEKKARVDPRKASEGRFDPRKENETRLDLRRENVANFDPRIEKEARFDPRKASGERFDPRKESETRLDPRIENKARFIPRESSGTRLIPRIEKEALFDPRKTSGARLEPRKESEIRLDPRIENEASFDPRKGGVARLDPLIENEDTFNPRIETEALLDPLKESEVRFDPLIENEARFDRHTESETRFDPRKESEACFDSIIEKEARFDPRKSEALFDLRKETAARFDLCKESVASFVSRKENEARFDSRKEREPRFDSRKESESRYSLRIESEAHYDSRKETEAGYEPRIENNERVEPRKESESHFDSRNDSEASIDSRNVNEARFDARKVSETRYEPRIEGETRFYPRKEADARFEPRSRYEARLNPRRREKQSRLEYSRRRHHFRRHSMDKSLKFSKKNSNNHHNFNLKRKSSPECFTSPLLGIYSSDDTTSREVDKNYGFRSFRIPQTEKPTFSKNKYANTRPNEAFEFIHQDSKIKQADNLSVIDKSEVQTEIPDAKQCETVVKEKGSLEKVVLVEDKTEATPKASTSVDLIQNHIKTAIESFDQNKLISVIVSSLVDTVSKWQKKTTKSQLRIIESDSESDAEETKDDNAEKENTADESTILLGNEINPEVTPDEPSKETEDEPEEGKIQKGKSLEIELGKNRKGSKTETAKLEKKQSLKMKRVSRKKAEALARVSKKKECRGELDMLHKQIKETCILDEILAPSGKGVCRIIKEGNNVSETKINEEPTPGPSGSPKHRATDTNPKVIIEQTDLSKYLILRLDNKIVRSTRNEAFSVNRIEKKPDAEHILKEGHDNLPEVQTNEETIPGSSDSPIHRATASNPKAIIEQTDLSKYLNLRPDNEIVRSTRNNVLSVNRIEKEPDEQQILKGGDDNLPEAQTIEEATPGSSDSPKHRATDSNPKFIIEQTDLSKYLNLRSDNEIVRRSTRNNVLSVNRIEKEPDEQQIFKGGDDNLPEAQTIEETTPGSSDSPKYRATDSNPKVIIEQTDLSKYLNLRPDNEIVRRSTRNKVFSVNRIEKKPDEEHILMESHNNLPEAQTIEEATPGSSDSPKHRATDSNPKVIIEQTDLSKYLNLRPDNEIVRRSTRNNVLSVNRIEKEPDEQQIFKGGDDNLPEAQTIEEATPGSSDSPKYRATDSNPKVIIEQTDLSKYLSLRPDNEIVRRSTRNNVLSVNRIEKEPDEQQIFKGGDDNLPEAQTIEETTPGSSDSPKYRATDSNPKVIIEQTDLSKYLNLRPDNEIVRRSTRNKVFSVNRIEKKPDEEHILMESHNNLPEAQTSEEATPGSSDTPKHRATDSILKVIIEQTDLSKYVNRRPNNGIVRRSTRSKVLSVNRIEKKPDAELILMEGHDNLPEAQTNESSDSPKRWATESNPKVMIEQTDLSKYLNRFLNNNIVRRSTRSKDVSASPACLPPAKKIKHNLNYKDETQVEEGAEPETENVLNTASAILKKSVKKRRRSHSWATARMSKRVVKKRRVSIPSISIPPEDEQNSTILEPVTVYTQPDKNYYINVQKNSECKLCSFKGSTIIRHYASVHPDHEVLISRLEPRAVKEAINESIEKRYNEFEITTQAASSKTRKKYTYKCRK